jgi:galactose mutarotase-like enzyme
VEDDGPARGARRIRLINGSGLELEAHPDRALDLGRVTAYGIPLAWLSPTGIAAPGLVENTGTDWLRTFGAGLLTTCGLDTFGPPSEDDGGTFGLHGRVGGIPARVSRREVTEQAVVVEGVVRQAAVLGQNLALHRRIELPLGRPVIRVRDVVTNEGATPAPHMVLYHCNLGWPLVDADTVLEVPSRAVEPRDDVARAGLGTWSTFAAPDPGYREQVFRHELDPGENWARVTNAELGLALTLTFSRDTLPFLYQWRQLGVGDYVLGLEPANCATLAGRRAAREAGLLPVLQPGQSVEYRLEFEVTRLP